MASGFTKMMRIILIGGLMLAGILYSLWPLGFWVNPEAIAPSAFISELAVSGQPGFQIFRLADRVAGIIFTLAVVILWPSRKTNRAAWQWQQEITGNAVKNALPASADTGRSSSLLRLRTRLPKPQTLLLLGLLLIGLATVMDSFFTLSCSPTTQESCVNETLSWGRPLTDILHEVASTLVQVGMITATAAATFTRGWGRTQRVLAGVTLVLSVLLMPASVVDAIPVFYFQAPTITCFSLWVGWWAWSAIPDWSQK
ncbi:DUF998 domain-containing protein [Boudabousia marimammalium]|uniref:DUF998 domain-containing protein n=1 Tax=Boudabousia marimammalium TaxID=156892 RepID=A0A1Q5PT32_9ACTO|nr:DUF998 domain-containing protein [Boudabousia marimammalium]OKL50605.1 hypothetical protein BM477_01210 [Boudabousia marimammalium]